ncbi:Uncharacterised protein [Bordetella pertussis]|nr:Uncharacterised protein [Bordetella pertussis]
MSSCHAVTRRRRRTPSRSVKTSRGWAMAMRSSSSTRLGGPDRTTTRSASVIASSRSCVTMTMVWPSLRQISPSSRCRWVLVWVSSAPKGSSSNRMRGSTARLISNATRRRMPPDNWCG